MQRIAFFLFIVLGGMTVVLAQPSVPKIGYAYPAGTQQGTTIEVILCGRQLAGAQTVLVSGTGVQGRVLRNCRMFVTDADTRTVLRNLFLEARARIENGEVSQLPRPTTGTADLSHIDPERAMSQYVHFDKLKEPTHKNLQLIYYEHFAPRPDRQPNQALTVAVIVELTVDADATPGDRELRLVSGAALSNPIRFQIGTVDEVNELEPNDTDLPSSVWRSSGENADDDPMALLSGLQLDFWNSQGRDGFPTIRQLPVLDLPIVVNGQIRRGDVDRFKFRATAGERLVIGVRARHLIPFLADAVPGWFQAAVTLFGPDGKLVAEASSYRTDPDPLILCEVPQDGVYTLEIRDSIFRGRNDFIYRISIGQTPLVTSIFPLGGRANQPLTVDLRGWNLPENVAVLDTKGDSAGIRQLTSLKGVWLPYPIRYAVDTLPEMIEKEPNDDMQTARKLMLPVIVNGRIDKPGDVDCFRFSGRAGQKVVLDVAARSLGSPLDGVLELLDASGTLVAFNDDRADCEGPNIGLETHHADPYLMVELPSSGEYIVRLYHSGSQGGPEYAYRLRISLPRPDFEVFVTPSGLTLDRNPKTFQAFVLRKDGFDGEIRLQLKNGFPGVAQGAATIPADADQTDCALHTDNRYVGLPRSLQFDAVATINGKEIVRAVTAVDDHEQAFIYHHWIPADSMTIIKPRRR